MFFGGTLQALLDKGFWPLQTGDNYAGFGPVPVWPMRTGARQGSCRFGHAANG
jgi:hypothetical protein